MAALILPGRLPPEVSPGLVLMLTMMEPSSLTASNSRVTPPGRGRRRELKGSISPLIGSREPAGGTRRASGRASAGVNPGWRGPRCGPWQARTRAVTARSRVRPPPSTRGRLPSRGRGCPSRLPAAASRSALLWRRFRRVSLRAIAAGRWPPPHRRPSVVSSSCVATSEASLNPADWHLISGVPYIARLQVGLRKPASRSPAATSRAWFKPSARTSQRCCPATRCTRRRSWPASAPSPNESPFRSDSSLAGPRTSPLRRLPPFPSPQRPPSRHSGTTGTANPP